MRIRHLIFLLTIILCASCSEKKVACPMCGGTGVFVGPGGIFATQSPCSTCDQTGQVSESKARQIYEDMQKVNAMFGGGSSNGYSGGYNDYDDYDDEYSSGNSSSQPMDLCSACGGSGHCPICKYGDAPKYGDIQYCESCGNSHKCAWCAGTGRR